MKDEKMQVFIIHPSSFEFALARGNSDVGRHRPHSKATEW
jgi:hypothetical protein